MGAYLSQPVTEKETYSGANQYLEYGGASMQVNSHFPQEHIVVPNTEANETTSVCGYSMECIGLRYHRY